MHQGYIFEKSRSSMTIFRIFRFFRFIIQLEYQVGGWRFKSGSRYFTSHDIVPPCLKSACRVTGAFLLPEFGVQ